MEKVQYNFKLRSEKQIVNSNLIFLPTKSSRKWLSTPKALLAKFHQSKNT